MPISITGTGTITGISAGGLPDDCITTAEIAGSAVTTAKILDANITSAKLAQPLTIGTAQATTSGTAIDFTGIPSWAKRVTVMLNGVRTNGATGYLIRVGTAGGVVSTGYVSTSITSDSAGNTGGQSGTTGFNWFNDNSAYVNYGTMTLFLIESSSNSWVSSHTGRMATTHALFGGGSVSLAGVLTQLRLTTFGGTETFIAGSVNIMYEG
jgi:hypothetical protein